MALYEYQCSKCGTVFERWSKQIRDMEWTELCPEDGAVGHRILSRTSFVLKEGGVGWAKNGYQKGNSNARKTTGEESSGS